MWDSMDLSLRLTILSAAMVMFTLCAFAVFFFQTRFRWLHQFNEAFLALFGIQMDHSVEIRYIVSWLLNTCLVVVNFVLIINIGDAFLLLTGLSGITLDPWIMPLAVGGVIASVVLLFVTILPALTMPASWPTALGIVWVLHLYGVHYAGTLLGLVSTFLYFAATAIGFVAAFLTLYLLFRTYLLTGIHRRTKRSPKGLLVDEASADPS
jgi:hypothetical protein